MREAACAACGAPTAKTTASAAIPVLTNPIVCSPLLEALASPNARAATGKTMRAAVPKLMA